MRIADPVAPHEEEFWMWEAVAHGAREIAIYAWYPMSSGFESNGYGLIHLDGSLTNRSQAAGNVARIIARHGAEILNAKPAPAHAAILYNRLSYMVGGSQPSLSKLGNAERDSLMGLHSAFSAQQIPVDFVHPEDVIHNKLGQYKVLFLPFPVMMSREVAEGVKRYVQSGGTAVAEARLAWNDERGFASEVIPGFGLAEAFGAREKIIHPVDNPLIKTEVLSQLLGLTAPVDVGGEAFEEELEPLSDAQVLARFADGEAALVEKSYGRGKAVLVGSFLAMAYQRRHEEATRRLVTSLAQAAGVASEVDVSGCGTSEMDVRRLVSDQRQIVFVFNHSKELADMTLSLHLPWQLGRARDFDNDGAVEFQSKDGKFLFQKKMPADGIWIFLPGTPVKTCSVRVPPGAPMRKIAMLIVCVLGVAAVTPGSKLAGADEIDARVDAFVQSELQRQRIPGAALGVYRDGRITKAQGYGLAEVEWDAAVTPDTIFQSGSMGKQFTATAVMMLVEEGKVGLEDPIKKYFPYAPEAWNDIKVHNLLSHTSGLGEYETGARTKVGGPFYIRMDFTEDELYKKITEMRMDFKPGEDWSYRNTNYVLLGILIHKVTGKFYGDFLQERIFKPLGMSRTRIISEEDIIPRRAAGYRLVKGELKNQEWVSPTLNSTADGALYFTAEDLQKWDAALYTEKLVKKASLDRMWTVEKLNNGKPNKANYGFGWEINNVNGHRVIEHGGAWQGFTTYIARYLDDRLTVVALTNLDSGHANPKKITSGVAAIYNPALKAPEEKPIADKEPQVTQMVRELLRAIADEKAEPEQFTEELQKKLFPDGMKELGPALKEFGEVKSLELMERTEEGEQRDYRYRATFPEMTMMVSIGLTKDKKVAKLEFSAE